MGYSAYKEAIALADLGHVITVVHGNSDITNYRDPRITFLHLSINTTPLIGLGIYYFKIRQLFKKQINLTKFDAIYIQSLEFGLVNLARLNIPIFYFARSTMTGLQNALRSEGIKMSPLARIVHLLLVTLERRCMYYSRVIFVKSHSMVSEIMSLYGINSKKIAVITGGIDTKDFQIETELSYEACKRKLGIPLDKYIVLYAGRIVPQKGLIYLVKAALNLLPEPSFAVVIVGANMSKSYTKSTKRLLVNTNHQNSFHFLGQVDQLDMPLIFNLADCVVTPSLYEPFGMVNLQAASLGKTVITTNVTGSADLLADYPNIKIVKPGSVEAIESTLREVLSLKTQKDQLSIDLSGYSWRNVAEKLSRYFILS